MVENKQVMAKNILYYMNKKNVTATDVCKACGFKQNTFSDWVNAKTYPRIDKIEAMARYFGINKFSLVEDTEEARKIREYWINRDSDIEDGDLSDDDKELLKKLHRVRPSTLDSINLLIEADLRKP